jgi:type IX secretion system substrate protein
MKLKLILFTVLAVCCILGTAEASPPDYTGKIVIDSKTVEPGSTFMIRINLEDNNIPLTGMKIPLKLGSPFLSCSYIDFTGSVKHPDMQAYYSVNGTDLEISFIPSPIEPLATISDVSGLIATLYISVDGAATSGDIQIDSILTDNPIEYAGTTIHRMLRLEFSEESGLTTLVPDIEGGLIEVKNSTSVEDLANGLMPESMELMQNYPNPFNPATTISFILPQRANIRVDIYNLLGQNIDVLADGLYDAGQYNLVWDASGKPSGVYFYRLTVGNDVLTRKMVMMK